MKNSEHNHQKISCAECSRAAFVMSDDGLSVRHQHGGERHETVLTIDEIRALLLPRGFVIFRLDELAAKIAA